MPAPDRRCAPPPPLLDALVLGLMAVAFNVSIAAIIYQGPLSVFVDRGIALTLIGGSSMGVVGAFCFSYRGTICQPQSTLAVVIALFAGDRRRRRARPDRARLRHRRGLRRGDHARHAASPPGCSAGCASASSRATSRSR